MIKELDILRFLKFVDKTPTCWNWIGCKRDNNGYGAFQLNGKLQQAHRVAWEIFHEERPQLHILHKCDNRSCVRANHLFQGANGDNQRDKASKNRTKGERATFRKLTNKDVLEIRSSKDTYKALSTKYGVGITSIHNIKTRKNWINI